MASRSRFCDGNFGPQNGERTKLQLGAEQDGDDDHAAEQHVESAGYANGPVRCGIRRRVSLAPVDDRVQHEEGRQHDTGREQRLGKQMLRRPEKIHALEEAEEQRRVAERRERAADIGDQEDEEHHDMHVVLSIVIGAKHGAYHHHRRAGGPDQAGENGADAEQHRICNRSAAKIAGHDDAAGYREQRQQKQDEGDVFQQGSVNERMYGTRQSDQKRRWYHCERRPDERDLAMVMFPEVGCEEREQCNRKQDADEWQSPRQPKLRPVHFGGPSFRWKGGGKRERCQDAESTAFAVVAGQQRDGRLRCDQGIFSTRDVSGLSAISATSSSRRFR